MNRKQAEEKANMIRMERRVRPLTPDERDFIIDYELGLMRFDD